MYLVPKFPKKSPPWEAVPLPPPPPPPPLVYNTLYLTTLQQKRPPPNHVLVPFVFGAMVNTQQTLNTM